MKRSFLLYQDQREIFASLSPQDCQELILAIFDYAETHSCKITSEIVRVVFISFKNQLLRDDAKYQAICERNRSNGQKGGRPKKPRKPSGLFGNPRKPKKPDNDNDNDNKNTIPSSYSSLKALTPEVLGEIAARYRVSVSAVKQLREELELYCSSKGKTYKDYRAALMNWTMRRIEEGKLQPLSVTSGGSIMEALRKAGRNDL